MMETKVRKKKENNQATIRTKRNGQKNKINEFIQNDKTR